MPLDLICHKNLTPQQNFVDGAEGILFSKLMNLPYSIRTLPRNNMNLPYSICTVNNKKNIPPCFSTLRSRISQEPFELQNIYLHLFISVLKELSAGTRIFQIR